MELDDNIYKELLGLCLVDPKKLPYITTKVKLEDIPKGIYHEIYKAIVDLYNLGVDVDIVTVSNRLLNTKKLKEVGGRSAINNLVYEVPASGLYKRIVDEAIAQTTYRNVARMLEDFKTSLDTSADVKNVCMEYCGKINQIVSGTTTGDSVETISSEADEVIEDLYMSRKRGCIGLDSGFRSINYFLGGLQKDKIYVIGGRPSMGKSAYAMNIAEYVAQDHNVLFISLEMSKKEYAQRLMFSRAGVDINKVNSGDISDSEISEVKEQKDYLDSLKLYIEAKTPCKVSDIELAIINLQSTRGSCDLVIVDYLQLLSPSTKSKQSREVEVAEISRELKNLAVKYHVPIIVLSQLSRALESREDKRPMLSDLRESGAIEQDADVVMFVYRDEWYHPDNPSSRGQGEILIRKNRGGVNNRNVEMCWQPSKVRFTEAISV